MIGAHMLNHSLVDVSLMYEYDHFILLSFIVILMVTNP